jgi:hypothetical protein
MQIIVSNWCGNLFDDDYYAFVTQRQTTGYQEENQHFNDGVSS